MSLLDPPGGKPWALLALCAASLSLNALLVGDRLLSGEDEPAPQSVATVEPTAAPAAPVQAPAASAPTPPVDAELELVRAVVERNLSYTFARAAPEHGDVLSAVYARLFFWDLDLRRDLQKGDEVAVAYEWDGELAHVSAASYRSGKLGRTLRAYRFQASGEDYPSFWNEAGTEVSFRLIDGPLDTYEQVTSLLKDRPSHQGMDFKVAVGTEVRAPRAGEVLRTDWNWKYNGNCVELRYSDGTIARFLHLSDTAVEPGQRLAAGEPLGATGNTGRSTAPHLHYELERGGRVVDPVEYHGAQRRSLPEADRSAFRAERERLDGQLAQAAGA